jgi:hypothetical protein
MRERVGGDPASAEVRARSEREGDGKSESPLRIKSGAPWMMRGTRRASSPVDARVTSRSGAMKTIALSRRVSSMKRRDTTDGHASPERPQPPRAATRRLAPGRPPPSLAPPRPPCHRSRPLRSRRRPRARPPTAREPARRRRRRASLPPAKLARDRAPEARPRLAARSCPPRSRAPPRAPPAPAETR